MAKKKSSFDELIAIVAKLRGPEGCPWDREQTHATLKPYMVEEIYEALEAIERQDYKKLCEELGDLLLHIVMHAQFAREEGRFDIQDVIRSINQKMIRRHPHVFGRRKLKTAEQVLEEWQKIKEGEAREKKETRGRAERHKGILESIPQSLPALYRADKAQRRAAQVGFDWNNVAGAWKKVDEEIKEVKSEVLSPRSDVRKIKEEIGDLLFAVVNVARKLNIDAEEALQASTSKFMRRFKEIEARARARKKPLKQLGLKEMDKIWNEIKKRGII